MSTAKQIAANRRNAQKATGPRTAAGKAASRLNSLKHGLYATDQFIFDETAEDFAELAAEYDEHHAPSNPEERLLVETLVASEWRLRRMRRVEIHMWKGANLAVQYKNLLKGQIGGPDPCSSGEAFLIASTGFERLQRVVNSCEREYHAALKDLAALAGSRSAPQPQQSAPTSGTLVSLQQNPQHPPTRAPNLETPPPAAHNLVSLQQNPRVAVQGVAAGQPDAALTP